MKNNIDFYTDLTYGKEKRTILALDRRFSTEYLTNNPSVQTYLLPLLEKNIKSTDKVLDFGCGPGTLFPIVAPLCRELQGVDVVPAFVEKADALIKEQGIENVTVNLSSNFDKKSFGNYFDVVLMVDVLHHMENPSDGIEQVYSALVPNGKLIIIEPNKLNPANFFMHLYDHNERKLLSMGNISFYKKLISKKFEIIESDWTPLVLGIQSRVIRTIASFLDIGVFGLLRCFLPKIFLIARKVQKI